MRSRSTAQSSLCTRYAPASRGAPALAIGIAHRREAVGSHLPADHAGDPTRDLRAPIVAGVVAAAAWLPFIIGAPDSLKALRPTVNVAPDSVLALFGVTNDSMPDWMRVAQLLACLASPACSLCAAGRNR